MLTSPIATSPRLRHLTILVVHGASATLPKGSRGSPAPDLIGHEPCRGIGAGGGTRTRTPLRTTDFKSVASTIPPRPHCICCLHGSPPLRHPLAVQVATSGPQALMPPATAPGSSDFIHDGRVWCGQEDSNLHDVTRYHLKVVRLPIPPWPHAIIIGGAVSNRRFGINQPLLRGPFRGPPMVNGPYRKAQHLQAFLNAISKRLSYCGHNKKTMGRHNEDQDRCGGGTSGASDGDGSGGGHWQLRRSHVKRSRGAISRRFTARHFRLWASSISAPATRRNARPPAPRR